MCTQGTRLPCCLCVRYNAPVTRKFYRKIPLRVWVYPQNHDFSSFFIKKMHCSIQIYPLCINFSAKSILFWPSGSHLTGAYGHFTALFWALLTPSSARKRNPRAPRRMYTAGVGAHRDMYIGKGREHLTGRKMEKEYFGIKISDRCRQ